jgi:hypothetical protein
VQPGGVESRDLEREAHVRKTIGTLAAVAVGAALLAVPTALAKDGDIEVAGTCTKATTSKLKLSEEDGGIEVEFEVDQNRNGVRWRVVLLRNGQQVASRVRVTRGPSGSFEARVVTGNRPGVDRFVARATRVGERCSARASWAA